MNQVIEPLPADLPLDASETRFAAIEEVTRQSFNVLSHTRKLVALAAGSAALMTFVEEIGATGSTTRAAIRAGLEIGGKAVSAANRTLRS